MEDFSDIKLDNGVKYGVAECCHKLFFTKAQSSDLVLFICPSEIKNRMWNCENKTSNQSIFNGDQ